MQIEVIGARYRAIRPIGDATNYCQMFGSINQTIASIHLPSSRTCWLKIIIVLLIYIIKKIGKSSLGFGFVSESEAEAKIWAMELPNLVRYPASVHLTFCGVKTPSRYRGSLRHPAREAWLLARPSASRSNVSLAQSSHYKKFWLSSSHYSIISFKSPWRIVRFSIANCI